MSKSKKGGKKAKILKMTFVERFPLKDMIDWDKNPRINDEAAKQLSKLISAGGYVDPVILSLDDNIVRAGHTRKKAAIMAGLTEIPAMIVEFASKEDAEMFAVANNKADEWSAWDEDLLAEFFEHSSGDTRKASRMTGFTQTEIEGLETPAASFASDSFREMAEKFERDNPHEEGKPLWVWFLVPSQDEMEFLREEYILVDGETGKNKAKELDWNKLLNNLGYKPRKDKGKAKVPKLVQKFFT